MSRELTKAGWVSLNRAITEHWIWQGEQFTKGQAWVDLILRANYKPQTLTIKGRTFVVQMGQQARSEVTLGEAWGWSRNKVRRFMKKLVDEGMVEQQTIQVTSIITICNYVEYQRSAFRDGTANETALLPNGNTPVISDGMAARAVEQQTIQQTAQQKVTATNCNIDILNSLNQNGDTANETPNDTALLAEAIQQTEQQTIQHFLSSTNCNQEPLSQFNYEGDTANDTALETARQNDTNTRRKCDTALFEKTIQQTEQHKITVTDCNNDYLKQPNEEGCTANDTALENKTEHKQYIKIKDLKDKDLTDLSLSENETSSPDLKQPRVQKPQAFKDFFGLYPAHRKGGKDTSAWNAWKAERLTEPDAQEAIEWLKRSDQTVWGTHANGQFLLGITKFIREHMWKTPIQVPKIKPHDLSIPTHDAEQQHSLYDDYDDDFNTEL
ncbi:hypothetical protein [Shewanella surugensis]|uniref:hypothetical protein n=1 Tax=Shewanella surugensis TaxID=212020 RepID=UPI0035D7D0CD